MRRGVVTAVVLFGLAVAASAQTRGAVDWIFLVDTSASMRGVGGSKDIFNDVKDSIRSFVREAGDGDSVAIYTFDREVRLHSATAISDSARKDLDTIIDGLQAKGDRTYLGGAIAKGLERAESLRSNADPTRRRSVVLFTDGKEDVRGIDHPVSIASNIHRVDDTFVFFVSMGDHEPQLDDFANATGQEVLKAPTRDAIREVVQKVRAKIFTPPPPPPPPPNHVLAQQPAPPPPPSPFLRALKWIVALAILALAAFAAFKFHRRQNELEGEIEILRPAVPPDAAYIGLPQLRANEIALSAIVPIDALAGNDARLFVRRKDGRKNVWISAQSGSLRINDVETPVSELYDADTIRIGEATLRFNRVGHERTGSIGEDL